MLKSYIIKRQEKIYDSNTKGPGYFIKLYEYTVKRFLSLAGRLLPKSWHIGSGYYPLLKNH
jgi:hypothetical protein